MNPLPRKEPSTGLSIVSLQLSEAMLHAKCHPCGCLQKTVEAIEGTEVGQKGLAPLLTTVRSVFKPQQYDCLGCPVCYPALAANAFLEDNPEEGANLDLCPTEGPEERLGWPPLPGNYHVIRYESSVAVCTLNSESLCRNLISQPPEGLSIIGTLHTENLGIEHIIKNVLANPHIRTLILCGEDSRQKVGHLPGQSIESLFLNGIDERMRIIGAFGKRPVLKNVSPGQVGAFLEQVKLIPLIGEENESVIATCIAQCHEKNPGSFSSHSYTTTEIQHIRAEEPEHLILDPSGYFVIYPEKKRTCLVVEHYSNQGVLDCVLEGPSAGALYCEAIKRDLLSRLDHAAYLGRELARAEESLKTHIPFVQDAAPGKLARQNPSCEAGSSCGCAPFPQTKREE